MVDDPSRPAADPRSFHVPAPGPGPAAPPVPPGPETPPPAGTRRRRRRRRIVVAVVVAIVLVGLVVPLGLGWWMWRSVERVDLDDALGGSGQGTNYLLVGTDSRAGLADDVENAGVIFGEGLAGERTDTIAVLHLGGAGPRLLAVPRDLYVPIDGGPAERVNAAFVRGGPAALVRTVRDALGIPIDHYLEVDFAGFLGLVDALGGVTIHFDHPARDEKSGLLVPTAGPVELDADTALAYVRSRSYVETVDGVDRRDPTSDLGRVQRQQRFLGAVFAELGDTYNPVTLLRVLDGVRGNVRVDDTMSFRDALSLGWTLRGLDPVADTVPTTPFTAPNGAAVLQLDAAAAGPTLDGFR